MAGKIVGRADTGKARILALVSQKMEISASLQSGNSQIQTIMTVSVIILNWNTSNLLQQFLPIVVKNSHIPGVEIVLADNGSTDDSVSWVKSNFPQVKTLEFSANLGFAGGYTKALSLVNTDLSVLLNSDAAPSENWLLPLIETMGQNSQTIACVPCIKDYNNQAQFEYAGAAGGFIDRFGYTFCRGRIFDVTEKDNGQYSNSGKIFWGSGAALLVRTNAFLETGGFDPDFFAHMEEIDWCWRVKNLGFDILYVPESVVYHVGGGTLNYNNPNKTYLNFRNNLFLILKNEPGSSVFLILFIRFWLDIAALLLFLLNGEFKNALAISKAHFHFLKKAGLFYKKRKLLKPFITKFSHPEIYRGSIAWDFFIRKKRYFSQLNFNPEEL
jgi:GT2 family glycosyltransferase